VDEGVKLKADTRWTQLPGEGSTETGDAESGVSRAECVRARLVRVRGEEYDSSRAEPDSASNWWRSALETPRGQSSGGSPGVCLWTGESLERGRVCGV
jgi:hypothetical protein